MVQIKSPIGRNDMKLEPIVNESEMIQASYDLGHKQESTTKEPSFKSFRKRINNTHI